MLLKYLTLYVAPAALACSIDLLTRSRLPSKSSAHWLRLQVASVAMRRGMLRLFSLLRDGFGSV